MLATVPDGEYWNTAPSVSCRGAASTSNTNHPHIMKLILLTVCFLFFSALAEPPAKAADDIFSPAKSKQSNTASYATLAELLAATKSGVVSEMLLEGHGEVVIGKSVITILQKEYGIQIKEPRNDLALECGLLLSNLTQYEVKNHDEGAADAYKHTRNLLSQEVPDKFMKAFDQLAMDYAKSVREYMVLKKGGEEAHTADMAEKQRKIAAGEKEAEQDRKSKKALADALIASRNAADEVKTAAGKEAMEAQMKLHKQKLDAILGSDAYKLWEAALQVEQGQQMITKAKKVLDYDAAVKGESGVTDLAAR